MTLLVFASSFSVLSGCADDKPVVIEATDESAQPENYEEMSMGDSNNQ